MNSKLQNILQLFGILMNVIPKTINNNYILLQNYFFNRSIHDCNNVGI